MLLSNAADCISWDYRIVHLLSLILILSQNNLYKGNIYRKIHFFKESIRQCGEKIWNSLIC